MLSAHHLVDVRCAAMSLDKNGGRRVPCSCLFFLIHLNSSTLSFAASALSTCIYNMHFKVYTTILQMTKMTSLRRQYHD